MKGYESLSRTKGFITSSNEILIELKESMENGNSIGIWAKGLGDGIFICHIESIREGNAENDKVVIVKENSLKSKTMHRHVIYLREIEKVHRFKTM